MAKSKKVVVKAKTVTLRPRPAWRIRSELTQYGHVAGATCHVGRCMQHATWIADSGSKVQRICDQCVGELLRLRGIQVEVEP